MAGIDRWNISPETRAKFETILDGAPKLGIDRDQAVRAGLPGLRALIGLKKAAEALTRKTRNAALVETREALRGVARRNPRLASQFEARILAMQGRGRDTEVAHVARGEIVVPQALQNAEVIAALRRAAAVHGVPVEMLLVGNAQNHINPETGAAEFGVMDWISRQFEKRPVRDEENPSHIAESTAEGLGGRYGPVGNDAINTRMDYVREVEALDPNDNAGREALKIKYRAISPEEARPTLNKMPLGPREGSVWHANVANPIATRNVRILGNVGRGLGALGVGEAIADTLQAEDKARAAASNAGGLVGGYLGGAAGAGTGAALGPAAPVAAPLLGFTGSAIGGNLGSLITEEVYDALHGPRYSGEIRGLRRMGGR